MTVIALRKYHGLGNDFLVLADPAVTPTLDPAAAVALARAACARRTGVGADGLLLVLPPPADGSAALSMRLHNADGGVAEMSGNGIRCFVQAALDAGLVAPGEVRVATGAGLRSVHAEASDARGRALVSVGMGRATLGSIPLLGEIGYRAALTVDVGNPHLVVAVEDALETLDMAVVGPVIEKPYLDGPTRGINVELVRPVRPGVIDMRVWERGVGVTEACGTGAVAVAVAARAWGWADGRVTVRQSGGDAEVEIGDDGELTLTGPSQRIAVVEFTWDGAARGVDR